jgi:hypothetical protein
MFFANYPKFPKHQANEAHLVQLELRVPAAVLSLVLVEQSQELCDIPAK